MSNGRKSVSHVTEGDVLDDLGLDPQSALELKLKYELHKKIIALIQGRGYTARQLEKLLDVQQPRVSELMRGKLAVLSLKMMLLYAKKLGADASINLTPAA